MPTITVSKHFESSPEIAFDVVSDFPNAASFVDGIIKVEMLTEGPVAVGTRVRETRIMMGREATEEMTVTTINRPTLFEVEAFSHGTEYVTSYTIEPTEGGANVTLVFKATPKTFMSKVLAALFSKMISTVADLMEKDLIQSSIEAKRRAAA
ncbi:SRPBCC family protein [uncultured Maritalea sp.]|jgi:ribosome-associated toxin RatA of RatAB toxin-antitoxin module|uniref:SRPBCC family protein n=1 Tax=uncultured Maritalea sp. TaxID=757249 RepID=UPI0026147B12|nr:SRPBCC family protein [uncultured Maritalea sp.]